MSKLGNEDLLKHLYEFQQNEDKMARVKFLVEILRCGWSLEEYCILQKNNEIDRQKEYTAEDYANELIVNKEFADAVSLANEIYSDIQ